LTRFVKINIEDVDVFNKQKQPAIKCLIGETSRIDGDLSFSDGLRVDGTVVGNVSAGKDLSSMLVISETATVTGELHADHVIVNGTVHGPVHARVMLELQPKARIHGDVHYTVLEMHRGALVSGQLRPIVDAGEAMTKDVKSETSGEAEEEKPTLKLAANSRKQNS
jgi:cytoskeletal protein CcmA (bactofilin family)